MGAQGTTTIDFGAFPGKSDASVAVAQPGISGGSLVEAWIFPSATADHSADEHMVETIKVFAHSVSAGVGFSISAFNTSQLNEPVPAPKTPTSGTRAAPPTGSGVISAALNGGGTGTRIYGQWTVAWVWN